MAEIRLTDENLSAVLSVAVLGLLTTEMKERVISEAVAQLIKPKQSTYGLGYQSALQEAFNHAVQNLSFNVAREYVAEHPEFRERIIAQLDKVAAEAMVQDERLRGVVVKALVGELARWQDQKGDEA